MCAPEAFPAFQCPIQRYPQRLTTALLRALCLGASSCRCRTSPPPPLLHPFPSVTQSGIGPSLLYPATNISTIRIPQTTTPLDQRRRDEFFYPLVFVESPFIHHVLELLGIVQPRVLDTRWRHPVQAGVAHGPGPAKLDQLAIEVVPLVNVPDKNAQPVQLLEVGVHLRDLRWRPRHAIFERHAGLDNGAQALVPVVLPPWEECTPSNRDGSPSRRSPRLGPR